MKIDGPAFIFEMMSIEDVIYAL